MDSSTDTPRLPVIIAHKDQRYVFVKPGNYNTMIQMARSYFAIPRGQTLVVSVSPEVYQDARVIWFYLEDDVIPASTPQHKVTDTAGPPVPVHSATDAELEVWQGIAPKSWEVVRDELIKTYDAPDMIFVVISNTSRRYKLKAHGTYSGTVMRWIVACVDNWEGLRFKIITDNKREELSEEKNLTEHGLKQKTASDIHLRIHPNYTGFPGQFGRGRYGGPYNYEEDDFLFLPDFPIYP